MIGRKHGGKDCGAAATVEPIGGRRLRPDVAMMLTSVEDTELCYWSLFVGAARGGDIV